MTSERAATRVRASRTRLPFAALAALALAGCVIPPSPAPRLPPEFPAARKARAESNLRVFDAVWDLVNRKYYDASFHKVDWRAAAATFGPQATAAADDEALYGAINGLLGLLNDSHTHALSPARAREHRTQERARTGFSLLRVDNRWVVTEVVPGSPAAEGGVKAGWLVRARNGVALEGPVDFHPLEGEVARWDFLDGDNRPVTLSLAAKMISTAPRHESRLLEGGVLYLRFDGFAHATQHWLHEELQARRDAPALVIDLRSNPGGGTFWLRDMLGEFFDRKTGVGVFTRREHEGDEAGSWQLGSVHYRGRMALLVDGGSASASEIFSAVLQERHRAVVVGRKTAGAVLASRFYSLPDGGQLQLSIEDYATPGGRRLEGEGHGVEPDVPVTLNLADVRAGRDRDLEAALRALAAP
ncbi:MAG TPA: S41 family peptidase [Opitutaceae bacterium]|nr:S41 family peptidase [Opitutaceae bacterium]